MEYMKVIIEEVGLLSNNFRKLRLKDCSILIYPGLRPGVEQPVGQIIRPRSKLVILEPSSLKGISISLTSTFMALMT